MPKSNQSSGKLPFFGTLFALTGIVFLFSVPLGTLPPLGSLFHPVTGFLSAAEKTSPSSVTLEIDGLLDPVDVFYNERGVPHIFAQNDHDLYFAQGFITARDRLFQLEVTVRGAEGALSEWLGDRMLNYDRNMRRIGMVYGAEKALEGMQNSDSYATLEAYSDGINAWINQLSEEDYPLEYKLLGVSPREWKPIYTALFLKYMTRTLAGGSSDLTTANAAAHFGEEFVDQYLAGRSEWMDPIISPEHVWNFDARIPTSPSTPFTPSVTQHIEPYKSDPGIGSNNWAISPDRTVNGRPLLAGDPHLNLSMPSIWYEMQLHAPGVNVYGVTLPGSPSVIMGFTESLAWVNTNTGADVLDWYEIQYRDETLQEYLFEGEWLETSTRIEEIKLKDGSVFTDTIRYTHHGPVVYDETYSPGETGQAMKGLAMRWIGHYVSNESAVYYNLNRGKTIQDAVDALEGFQAPAQNFAVIDGDGNIGMLVSGSFPLKWEGQGSVIGDGSSDSYEWNGWVPYDHNPRQINPERGFVSSANQFVTAESYPYYLGDRFAPFERGRRINDLLREDDQMTLEKMKAFQLDSYNYLAAVSMPVVLEHLTDLSGEFNDSEKEAFEILQDWDYVNEATQIAPSLFNVLWDKLYDTIWQDEYEAAGFPMRWPKRDLTAQMLVDEPNSPFYDNVETPERTETLADLVLSSFRETVTELSEQYGSDLSEWVWGTTSNVRIPHIADIAGLGVTSLFTNGGDQSLNAINGRNGPSWRMVVELGGDMPVAYGVYPGGQSGNPGSPGYDEFVKAWEQGEYYLLELLQSPPSIETPDTGGSWTHLRLTLPVNR